MKGTSFFDNNTYSFECTPTCDNLDGMEFGLTSAVTNPRVIGNGTCPFFINLWDGNKFTWSYQK